MNLSILSPLAPSTLALAESLLDATVEANAAEPYIHTDYAAVAAGLEALLNSAFGAEDGRRVREATFDGITVAEAIDAVKRDHRSRAADDYDMATAQQAEHDALAAFDAVAAGEGDVAVHLRTFAAATDHLATIGAGLVLGGTWVDRDTTDARMVAAARLVPVTV